MNRTSALFVAALLLAADAPAAQSLAQAARREAERRKALDAQGVQSKTIVAHGIPAAEPPPKVFSRDAPGPEIRPVSAARYRAGLAKLQKDILQTRQRLESVRKRLELDVHAPLRFDGGAPVTGASRNLQKLRDQRRELESRLNRLQAEKRRTYEEGRKAGLLPGELDGKGIIP